MSTAYLVDTNILLRYVEEVHPLHQLVFKAVERLRDEGNNLFIVPQNCIEFWNVATRPLERNGFGKSPLQANAALQIIERLFPVLPDIPIIHSRWRRLVVEHNVSGVQVHDARLVAAMLTHGISSILTFNATDFTRYQAVGISAIDPNQLAV